MAALGFHSFAVNDFRTDMSARTRSFALRVLRLCGELHGDYVVEHVGKQVLKAASSVAANFRAACHAKSSSDFFSKLKMCEEKSIAACFWLDFIIDGQLKEGAQIESLKTEAYELASILSKTCLTLNNRK